MITSPPPLFETLSMACCMKVVLSVEPFPTAPREDTSMLIWLNDVEILNRKSKVNKCLMRDFLQCSVIDIK